MEEKWPASTSKSLYYHMIEESIAGFNQQAPLLSKHMAGFNQQASLDVPQRDLRGAREVPWRCFTNLCILDYIILYYKNQENYDEALLS